MEGFGPGQQQQAQSSSSSNTPASLQQQQQPSSSSGSIASPSSQPLPPLVLAAASPPLQQGEVPQAAPTHSYLEALTGGGGHPVGENLVTSQDVLAVITPDSPRDGSPASGGDQGSSAQPVHSFR